MLKIAISLLALAAITASAQSVPDATVRRELDSLRAVKVSTDRYCGTSNATGYMRTACLILARSTTRLAAALATAPTGGTGNAGHTGYAVSLYYNSPTMYQPPAGVDTVTVCAVVEDAIGQKKLGWPPVRMRTIGDSARWGARGGNPLSQMCARAITAAGLTRTDSLPVTWNGQHITVSGRTLWRPFAWVP
jgi:hypothetical protein